LLPRTASQEDRARLQALWQWTERGFEQLRDLFGARKRDGSVRECHGDLHLGNVALVDGTMCAFDGIEFNPHLRWIDVVNEIAFMVMDLAAHGRRDLASLFLNEYLERTGDYDGVALLRFYVVYRALVRAKTECLRALGAAGDSPRLPAPSERYLTLATACSKRSRTALVVLHGLSGCGKTTVA